jgi:RNA 2',3'-cyclic 3'-phosphodiesterase
MGVACQAMTERKLNGISAPPAVRCFVGARVERGSARRLRAAFLERYPHLAASLAASSGAVSAHTARLVPLVNLHVTIKFLGQVPVAALPGLVALVNGLHGRPVTAQVLGYTGLPRPERAHSVVAELARHERLEDWKLRLEQTVGAEDRPFRPHVTLARFRAHGAIAAALLAQPRVLELEAPRLFRSDQVRGGFRYTPVNGPEP